MNPEKDRDRYAIKGAGFLFLLTMASAIVGNLFIVELTSGEDYLTTIHASQYRLGLAGFFMLINALGVIGIGVLIYPTLTRLQQTVALTYMAARIFEAVVLTMGFVAILTLVALAKESVKLTEDDSLTLYVSAKTAIQTNWYAYHSAMVALSLGSLPFCLLLYRFKMVATPLAGLGLLGYAILGITSLLSIIGIDSGLYVTIPVFLFEITLGFRLLVKGLDNNT